VEAFAAYRRALAIDPENRDAPMNIGNLLFNGGEVDEAAFWYRRAVAADPRSAPKRFSLGRALLLLDSVGEGLDEVRAATQLEPAWPVPWALLAWALATEPDEAMRDSTEAVRAGEEAQRLAGIADPNILDALAAAYASAGRFDDAVAALERALGRVTMTDARREEVTARLALYRERRPYRRPAR
jgi:tetratricopeptide (TPR) repeat protein